MSYINGNLDPRNAQPSLPKDADFSTSTGLWVFLVAALLFMGTIVLVAWWVGSYAGG